MLPRDLVRRCATHYPDKVAYYWGHHTRTWAEMEHRSSRLGAALAKLEIGKGDVVAILGHESFEVYEHFFACMKTGAIRVSVNRRYPPAEIMYVLRDSGASVLLVNVAFIETLKSVRGEIDDLGIKLIGFGGEHALSLDYETLMSGEERSVEPEISESDPLFYSYTSGTTGTPKGVILSHGSLVSTVFQSLAARGMLTDDIWYMPGQSSWLTVIMLMWGLGNGMSHVLPYGEFEIGQYLSDIERLKVTVASMVPTVMQRAVMKQREAKYDLSSLREITYGSAPASYKLVKEASHVFGCGIVQAYGSTEAGGWVTHLTPSDHRYALENEPGLLASAGRVGVFYELTIRDEKGNILGPNEVGEIWVRGKSVMKGYLNLPDLTSQALRDGWLCTNDIGRLDERGYLYLVDRKNFMILTGAVNVFPSSVETVLLRYPAVLDAAVTGVPHPEWGEAVVAVLQLDKRMVAPSSGEIVAFCAHSLSKPECPKLVVFDEIPKTSTGKTDRTQLKKRLAAHPTIKDWKVQTT